MVLQETMSKPLQPWESGASSCGLVGFQSWLLPWARMKGEAAQILLNMFAKKELGVRRGGR